MEFKVSLTTCFIVTAWSWLLGRLLRGALPCGCVARVPLPTPGLSCREEDGVCKADCLHVQEVKVDSS